MCIYYMIAYQIALYQGKKLLEEDKETVKVSINLNRDIAPEDIEITYY